MAYYATLSGRYRFHIELERRGARRSSALAAGTVALVVAVVLAGLGAPRGVNAGSSHLYNAKVLQRGRLLAFVHIPKCAGSAFMSAAVHLTNATQRSSWYPGARQPSSSSADAVSCCVKHVCLCACAPELRSRMFFQSCNERQCVRSVCVCGALCALAFARPYSATSLPCHHILCCTTHLLVYPPPPNPHPKKIGRFACHLRCRYCVVCAAHVHALPKSGQICGVWPRGGAPTCRFQSFNAPGCAAPFYGGTHCGFAELNDCLKTGRAKLSADLAGHSPAFVSIIRDPVDRVVSEFFWWKKTCKNTPQWTKQLCTAGQGKGEAPFRAWLRSPHNNAANRMTKMLSNVHGMRAPEPGGEHCTSFDAGAQETFWSQAYNLSYDTGLEDAINRDDILFKNVMRTIESHFVFIGIQDLLVDSLRLLHYLLAGHDNATLTAAAMPEQSHSSSAGGVRARTKIAIMENAELLAEVRARNQLDVRLYEYVATRFKKSCEELLP